MKQIFFLLLKFELFEKQETAFLFIDDKSHITYQHIRWCHNLKYPTISNNIVYTVSSVIFPITIYIPILLILYAHIWVGNAYSWRKCRFRMKNRWSAFYTWHDYDPTRKKLWDESNSHTKKYIIYLPLDAYSYIPTCLIFNWRMYIQYMHVYIVVLWRFLCSFTIVCCVYMLRYCTLFIFMYISHRWFEHKARQLVLAGCDTKKKKAGNKISRA